MYAHMYAMLAQEFYNVYMKPVLSVTWSWYSESCFCWERLVSCYRMRLSILRQTNHWHHDCFEARAARAGLQGTARDSRWPVYLARRSGLCLCGPLDLAPRLIRISPRNDVLLRQCSAETNEQTQRGLKEHQHHLMTARDIKLKSQMRSFRLPRCIGHEAHEVLMTIRKLA